MSWTYTDSSNRIVVRIKPDGGMESRLVTEPEVAQWIAAGNTPAAAQLPDLRPAVVSDFRARRDVYLYRLTGIAVFSDDALVKAAAKTFRQRLLDIPQNASVISAVDAAAMKAAILTLYRAAADEAVLAAPAGKVEFDLIAK